MLCDYHIHLVPDSHTQALVMNEAHLTRYIEYALSRGVTEIGISEHCYRFNEFKSIVEPLGEGPGAYREVKQFFSTAFLDHLGDYVAFLQKMQQKGYPVKIGLEVDYIVGQEAQIAAVVQQYSWDYLIGSVHFVAKWSVDASPELGWPELDVDQVYNDYFATWNQACASGLFTSMSHPDLVKKFGHVPRNSPVALYKSAAHAAAAAGVAVEVSSAGLRKPIGEIYPSMGLLKEFYAAGVPITLGSDAHVAEDVGLQLDAAANWARAAGYIQHARFAAGKYELVPLG
ncbi:MAG TPA: histidinol-phosphatase HisJ family protein [Firmicutes bacterium]|jgi:histidinol-phosphatase (PHP family)|nr:histidinol-phosphatase HisJ family protein [Bacillota bacterium]